MDRKQIYYFRLVMSIVISVLFFGVGVSSVAIEVGDGVQGQLTPVEHRVCMPRDNDWNYWNNSPHMFAIPSGNIGIGTENPQYNLTVESSSPFAEIALKSQSSWPLVLSQKADSIFQITNGGQVRYTLKPDGKIGIGAWDPEYLLDVRGNNKDDGGLLHLGNSDGSHKLLFFSGRENDTNPFILWNESDPLRFATNQGGFTELMRIQNNGNVGIGNSNPLSKLEVAGVIHSTSGGFKFPDGTTQTTAATGGGGGNTLDMAYDQSGPGAGRIITADAGPVNISGPDGLTVEEHVGIGTDEPSEKLDVVGNIELNSTFPTLLFQEDGENASRIIHEGPFDTGLLHIQAYWWFGEENTGLTITSPNQNVGIGTRMPTAKLEVLGTTRTSALDVLGQAKVGSFKMTSGAGNGKILTSDANGIGTWKNRVGNTLNQAYDQGGAGNGRTIIADAGPVNISGPDGLQVQGNFTVTPMDPCLIGKDDMDMDRARELFVTGQYAYIAEDSGLWIYDIFNVSSPTKVNLGGVSGDDPHDAESVYVAGRYAYVLEPRLYIIDISDRSNPVAISNVDLPGNDVYVSGKYAYITSDYLNELLVVNVTDPANPLLAGSTYVEGGENAVYVAGGYAYCVGHDFSVFDVSDPANPMHVGHENQIDEGQDIYVSGMYAYVADGHQGFKIVDVCDPSQPMLVASFQPPEPYHEFDAYGVYGSGDYVYLVVEGSDDPDELPGLWIFDVSEPLNPRRVGYNGVMLHGRDVWVSGKYAYTVSDDNNEGFHIYQIAGVTTPTVHTGNIETADITVTDNADIGNDAYVHGGMSVGEKLLVDGDAGVGSLEVDRGCNLSSLYVASGPVSFVHEDPIWFPDNPPKFLWKPMKGAIRAGRARDDQWDDTNIGEYSTAFGYNTKASGYYTTALGREIDVEGENSVGIGLDSSANTITANNVLSIMGGKVGIGETNPGAMLDVAGYIKLNDVIRARDNGGLNLQTDDGINRIIIADNGRVGIDTNPVQALDVDGDIRVGGDDIYDNANVLRVNFGGSYLELKDIGGTTQFQMSGTTTDMFTPIVKMPNLPGGSTFNWVHWDPGSGQLLVYPWVPPPSAPLDDQVVDELETLGLTEMIHYNEHGEPESIDYSQVSLHLLEIIKNQEETIQGLQTQYDTLEGRIAALEQANS